MYLSMLAGAMWGMPLATPLVCVCIATGSSLCYLLSQYVGPCLLAVPRWEQRIQTWKAALAQYDSQMLTYLALIRYALPHPHTSMMPVPPDFVINLVAPHLGIALPTFWLAAFLGVLSTTLIHTAIGEELNEMTSATDFPMFTAKNALIVVVVGAALVVPIVARRYVQPPEDDGAQGTIRLEMHAPSLRARIHTALRWLLAKIHPAWRPAVRLRSPSLDNHRWGESVAAWRSAERPVASPSRTWASLPHLATDEAFPSDDDDHALARDMDAAYTHGLAHQTHMPHAASRGAPPSTARPHRRQTTARRWLQRLGIFL